MEVINFIIFYYFLLHKSCMKNNTFHSSALLVMENGWMYKEWQSTYKHMYES